MPTERVAVAVTYPEVVSNVHTDVPVLINTSVLDSVVACVAV